MFPNLLKIAREKDITQAHYALIGINKIMEAEGNLTQPLINSGIIPFFIELVKQKEYPQLQYEAALALLKVADGSPPPGVYLIDRGAIPIFVELARVDNTALAEQAL